MPDTIRTFIAVEIPENIISSIRNLQQDLKDYGIDMRWVRPENIHITLKFFGNVKAADTDKEANSNPQTMIRDKESRVRRCCT